eukprot:TRINITY_DN19048_c0_g1_i1.p1 TRINITY_DN19048_c0_g1~~TRINITY_DN19048_c0_g1_i1.p1  ORF type:complete len:396 (-),score=76.27 TRINITY_DN19048_c0_g1_i1:46-1233(-)
MFKLLTALCLVLTLGIASAQIIPNEYIILFRENTTQSSRDLHIRNITSLNLLGLNPLLSVLVKDRWTIGNFAGYSANILSPIILQLITSAREIESIEPNQIVRIQQTSTCRTQSYSRGLWGLNRITTARTTTTAGYKYLDFGGSGIDNYVLDTGINLNHTDFGGRAIAGVSFVSGEPTSFDLNGHGTHCAGTIGGATYGIAKRSTLIAVKVLGQDGSGSLSSVLSGCEWVANRTKTTRRRSTANLSLGASFSSAVNRAVNSLWDAGVFVAVAAGNSNVSACNASPASAEKVVAVGATDINDNLASYSNWGSCVDIIAPGSGIQSTWIGSNTASATSSGTSMASPHVAGVASLYMSAFRNVTTPAQVRSWLLGRASKVGIKNLRGTPDLLLFQGCY